MARTIATTSTVDRAAMEEFVRPRHRAVLLTHRRDGGVQMSPTACGMDAQGRLVVSTYPDRAKAVNLRRDPRASACILSEDWNGPWIQLDGTAEVLDMPDALEPLVDYFRVISGEHPDWDEYREAMRAQDKSLVRVTVTRWGPVATGGFPARLVED
ncbi:PPOX class F420-dependent oxidoreductase [Georgenia wangjunii]|uniref:PPOX class F420-dependent oxidoreductase n=1 Tax=Georgenia wangjunii TaxID=3117730 RepID=UPI002F25F33A